MVSEVAPKTLRDYLSLLPYALLLASAFLMFNETADDPFITFRYAANIVGGHGPVFNIGEHVEGFSSPLHLLLCVVLLKVFPSIGLLFKAKLISLGCGLIAIGLTGKLVRQIGGEPETALVAQLLSALNVNFAIASVNGLETTLYTVLLLVCAIQFVIEYQQKRGTFSAFLLWLAWLARPEAILTFGLLFVLRLTWVNQRIFNFTNLSRWLILFLAPTACVVLARVAYYGQLFPNTYYAKNAPLAESLKTGLHYLLKGLSPNFLDVKNLMHGKATPADLFYMLVVPLFWGLAVLGWTRLRDRYIKMTLASIIGAAILFILRSGGDWMIGCRFLIAAVPFIAILQSYGLLVLVELCQKRREQRGKQPTHRDGQLNGSLHLRACKRIVFILALAVWFLTILVAPLRPWSASNLSTEDSDLIKRNSSGFGLLWITAMRYIKANVKPDATIAFSEMGYCAFYNLDHKFMDTRGLTDHEIAMLPAHFKSRVGVSAPYWDNSNPSVGQILQRRQPDMILDFVGLKETIHTLDHYKIMETIPVEKTAYTPLLILIIYKRIVR